MTDAELIDQLRARAGDEGRRTDFSGESLDRGPRRISPVAPPVSPDEIVAAEDRLGFSLHPLHRRLFEEIGNGGFGPGDGILGLPGGYTDANGRSAIELSDLLGDDAEHLALPAPVLPLCDLGCGAWVCVDEDSGRVLTAHEEGLTDTGMDLASFLADWLDGVNLVERMFTFEQRTAINPFTRAPMIVRSRAHAIGTPYRSRVSMVSRP